MPLLPREFAPFERGANNGTSFPLVALGTVALKMKDPIPFLPFYIKATHIRGYNFSLNNDNDMISRVLVTALHVKGTRELFCQ